MPRGFAAPGGWFHTVEKRPICFRIMIVSASYRTDIPAFYADWFLARLREGRCRVANPYGGRPSEVSLRREDADGFVFWTRNARPFAAALREVTEREFPFMVQFTLLGYPRTIDASVIDTGNAVAQIRELARRYGPRAVVWRYDPVVVTSITDVDWHRANFRTIADALAGATDEAVVSFMAPYRKTRRNLDAAAARAGFDWSDPDVRTKRTLLMDLARIASERSMRLTLCSQPELLTEGIEGARCVDAERLSDLAGYRIVGRTKGNRAGCLCTESRDIGAYDTCPHGCAYCYAVRSPVTAKRLYRRHDKERDILQPADQTTGQAEVSTRCSAGSPLATPTMAARKRRPLMM